MCEPLKVVQAFIAAWNRMDFDAVVGALAPDICYHNMPLEPIDGLDNVASYLRGAWTFSACDWSLLSIAVDGDKVLTERVDAFTINEQPVVLPVMGIFEVRHGLIASWRDYFDLADYRKQLLAATAANAG